jgi:hypothetical protein
MHRAGAKTASGARRPLTWPPSGQKCRGRSICVPAWLENSIRLFSSLSPFSKDFVRVIASGSVPG